MSYANPYLARRAGYAENWNLGFQHALTAALTLNVNYSGSESHFLSGGSEGVITNQLDPRYEVLGSLLKQLPGTLDKANNRTYLQDAQLIVPGIGLPYKNFGGPQATIQAMLLPHPQYGSISNPWGAAGNTNYHSLQLSLAQRHLHRFDYAVNYTFSKTIGDTSISRTGYAIPAAVMTDGIARRKFELDRGLDAGSVPNLLRIYGVWDLPLGRSHHFLAGNRVVGAVVGGWSLSGIFTYNSGSPLQVTASGCQVLGQGTCMLSYTPGYSKTLRTNGKWGKGITAATASKTPYIDASAFTVPNVTYQIANAQLAGAYNLTGPGYKNQDGSLRRRFPLWREAKLVVQADVFNVSNSVRFNVTPASTTSGQAGNSLGTNTNSTFSTVSSQANAARDWQSSGHINF